MIKFNKSSVLAILLAMSIPTVVFADIDESKLWNNVEFEEMGEKEYNEDSILTAKLRERLEKDFLKSQVGNNTKTKQEPTYNENTEVGEFEQWKILTDSPERKVIKGQVLPISAQDLDNVINIGLSVLGNQYSYGGNNPYVPPEPASNDGIDCSAFVKFCFKYGANIDLVDRTTSAYITNLGIDVKQSEMQIGDVIMFSGTPSASSGVAHTGIYIGDKKVLHASGTGNTGSIKISTLNGSVGSYQLYSGTSAQAVKAVKRIVSVQ